MNGSGKVVGVAAAVALTAALGAGLYYAWQEGLLPAKLIKPPPRAPAPQNFLATLQASDEANRSLRPACLRLALRAPRRVDRMGPPGLAYKNVPGWGVISVAQVPGDGLNIAGLTKLLDALVDADLYSSQATEIEDDAGSRVPAKTYSLTLAGWAKTHHDDCLQAGTPVINEIVELARVTPDKDGKQVYEVRVRYSAPEIAPWADEAAEQGLALPADAKRLREPGTATFRLLRVDSGWEVERAQRTAPPLTKAFVLDSVAKAGGLPEVCIRLPRRDSPARFAVATAPFALTLYDDRVDGLDPRVYSDLLLWQRRLAALVRAGVFSQSAAEPNPAQNVPAGTRYALEASWQPWLHQNDPGCLRMGDATMDLVGLSVEGAQEPGSDDRTRASATAKVLLRLGKEAWIEKFPVALPEVDAVREAGGLPVVARFLWSERETEGKWRLAGLEAAPTEPVAPLRRAPLAVVAAAAPQDAAIKSARDAGAPAPAAARGGGGDVTWLAGGEPFVQGRISNEGLSVTYCCAGASSTTTASRSVATGKAYAEFQFKARPNGLKADTYTTIGVIADAGGSESGGPRAQPQTSTLWPNRNEPIKDQDVIGMAMDLDAGQLYFSRNGEWLNGRPGGGGGVPLPRGAPYVAAAVVSASSSSGGTDVWTANFGRAKFRYPIPAGFRSYDGRQG